MNTICTYITTHSPTLPIFRYFTPLYFFGQKNLDVPKPELEVLECALHVFIQTSSDSSMFAPFSQLDLTHIGRDFCSIIRLGKS